MKRSFKIALAALVCVALVYTNCKKSATSSTPSNTPANNMAISKQIAGTFIKSLNGEYGGAKIGDGIKAPSNPFSTQKGPRVNSVTSYCGYTIDTSLFFTRVIGDTTRVVGSKYKFIYTCSNGALNGYILSDSITYTDNGTLLNNKYLTGQNYAVNNFSSGFSVVLIRGTLGTNYSVSALNKSHIVVAYNKANIQYYLNALTVNVTGSSPNITSGSTDFNASISYLQDGNTVEGNYSGSMQFLGNHLVKITLTYNGVTTVYSYNLITQEIGII
ncbi:MAG: hypothetical protein JWQ34_1064 [Mucilaginibacter sp.]|uniref:hypothetical protein n=1 Tax=Mucilaginibacter sp. TaxID=1882438 RepID=UPI0026277D69|nr:hypothetical protein [Mucilaginibacter sp.]MDB5002839.1 hypothetical protein [Mucilaginibacter sp.]